MNVNIGSLFDKLSTKKKITIKEIELRTIVECNGKRFENVAHHFVSELRNSTYLA